MNSFSSFGKDSPNDWTNLNAKVESRIIDRIESILIWDNSRWSSLAVIGFSLAYWFAVWSDQSIVTILALFGFGFGLVDLTINLIWSNELQEDDFQTVDPVVLSARPERLERNWAKLKQLAKIVLDALSNLRQEFHGLFCIAMIVFVVLIDYLGRTISGEALAFVCVLVFLVVPGMLLHILPDQCFDGALNRLNSLIRFMNEPEKSIKDADLNQDSEELADFVQPELTDETSDSDLNLEIEFPDSDSSDASNTSVREEANENRDILPSTLQTDADSQKDGFDLVNFCDVSPHELLDNMTLSDVEELEKESFNVV